MAEIDLDQTAAASIATPAVNTDALFFDLADGYPKWKDSTGTVHGLAPLLENVTDNGWFNVQDHGVLPTNTAATNSTNIAALITLVSIGAVLFFPPGTYQFASAISVTKQVIFMGSGQYQSTVLQTTS